MKGLVLYPRVDPAQDKEDSLDEAYFRLLARRFRRAHGAADIRLEEYAEDDTAEFMADIAKAEYHGLDLFAYIGHGGTSALYSADVDSADEITALTNALRAACNDDAVIIFYACNAGRLNDSILRTVYLNTIDKRFRLYGHSSTGRAGNNPDKTVFPPANGAHLLDECLGSLASAPRFRRAWDYTMGNESDDLWATFFTLSHDALLRRACGSVIRRAVTANRRQARTAGWSAHLDQVHSAVGVGATASDEDLAVAIARWQADHLDSPGEVDGILGPTSWRVMQRAD